MAQFARVLKVLAATAERLCREYLMGARRSGAAWRDALRADLAKGAPMLHRWTKEPGSVDPEITVAAQAVHDRAADPVALLAQYHGDWKRRWRGLRANVREGGEGRGRARRLANQRGRGPRENVREGDERARASAEVGDSTRARVPRERPRG
jgi:hypothetical protein